MKGRVDVMRFLLVSAAAIALSACATKPAHAFWPRSPFSIACPQGAAWPTDGCAALATPGNFSYGSYSAFATAAKLSGQMWNSSLARPPWNMAGVDYAIGYYTARGSLKVPGSDTPPTGCVMTTYNPSGPTGSPEMLCSSTSSSINFTGWDFHPLSGPNAGKCVLLRIVSNATGATLTIADSHFQMDIDCTKAGSFGEAITNAAPASVSMLVTSNEFDGGAENTSSVAATGTVATTTVTFTTNPGTLSIGQLLSDNTVPSALTANSTISGGIVQWNTSVPNQASATLTQSSTIASPHVLLVATNAPAVAQSMIIDNRAVGAGPAVWSYNYFHDIAYRPGNGANGDATWMSNLFVNWCILCSASPFHGEVFEYGPTGAADYGTPVTTANYINDFNTVIFPNTAVACCTTTFYFTGWFNNVLTYTEVKYNTIVGNASQDGNPGNIAASIMETATNQLGSVVVRGNFVDNTGGLANKCIVQGAASRSFLGSLNHTVMTISGSSLSPNGNIVPGGVMYTGGFPASPVPTVLAYGTTDPNTGSPSTGVGGDGTYVLSVDVGVHTLTGATEQSLVGSWDTGTGGFPTPDGVNTANWSMLTNSAISGASAVGGSPATCS